MGLPSFTDQNIYLQGTCKAMCLDPKTGNVDYYSDKFSTANVTTSNNENIIRSGLGNGIATIIPTDCDVSVDFASDAFSLWAKSANVGAKLSFGAPVLTCTTATATGNTLKADITKGTPVAGIARTAIECYVQEVGAAAPVATTGAAYQISPTDGTISGFTAVSGKSYKVFYYISTARAQMAAIPSQFNPRVEYFTAQIAGYRNVNAANNSGTRAGWLYVIIPLLKFGGANGGIDGSQTAHDTTHLVGRALTPEDAVVTDSCEDCGGTGSSVAYYVWVEDDASANIDGLVLIGGVVSVPKGGKAKANFLLAMADGSLMTPDPAFMSYDLTTAPTGVTVDNSGVLTATASATGDGELTGTYTDGGTTFTLAVNVTVTA